MIIATASNAYILFFKRRPTRVAFLKRARVKRGTYAEEFIGDIYDDVFLLRCELRREYERYYSLEYPRFSIFMSNFGHMPPDLCAQADRYYQQYTHIIPYITFQWFLQNDEGLRLLARLFNLKIKS